MERNVSVPCKDGLHLRVAAKITTLAKTFDAVISLIVGQHRANAASILSVLELGAGAGVPVRVTASGQDAQSAVQALGDLFESGTLCQDQYRK